MSLPQPAQYIRPLAAVLDVIDDPRVEVSGVGVGLVGHRLGGRLERHRNRLVPVARGQQVVGQVDPVRIRLTAQHLGRAGVQALPFGRDQVVQDGFTGQRVAEAVAAAAFLVHQLLLDEVTECGEHRRLLVA